MSIVSVRARGLVKRFGAVAALEGIDLDLGPGDVLAVLGPNGAGKSTLLRILAALARPTSGEVELRIDDVPVRSRAAQRSLVGFAGHATLLHPELSARENLVFHGRLHGVPDPHARAEALLSEERLADVAERRAGTFSRGMAQRLSIARALVHDPPLVLLDEPFTGLDRRAGDRLAARLTALRAERRSVVLVTHDLDRASALATRAIVLLAGKVVHEARDGALEPTSLEAAYAQALDAPGAAA